MNLFKTRNFSQPKESKTQAKIHEVDGVGVCFKFDERRIYGWHRYIKEGDEIHCPMESGKIGRFRVTNFRRMTDPSDQYFADVTDIAYVGDTLESTWKRKGLMYESRLEYQEGLYVHTITRRLDFLAFHLIKYYHGDDKLLEMANKRGSRNGPKQD